MKKIAEQPPPKEAIRIAQTLSQLGFDVQLLGSTTYLLRKLQNLNGQDLTRIKNAFIKNKHPRFMKQFSTELPFGNKEAYTKAVTCGSIEKLANLIKVCGFLLQTKTYLLWMKAHRADNLHTHC